MISLNAWVERCAAVLLLYFLISENACASEPIRVAVAANFLPTLETIVEDFQGEFGHEVSVSMGASGALYAQIRHGAPYDVFLSADAERPRRLESGGFTRIREPYALGRLVFWVRGATEVSATQIGEFASLSMANPRHAPYGQAAVSTLAHLDIQPEQLVQGNNVAQAYTFIATGNVAAGFVALSQVTAAKVPPSSYWLIPARYHEPIQQEFVVTRDANPLADEFATYLTSEKAAALIRRAGYVLPGESP